MSSGTTATAASHPLGGDAFRQTLTDTPGNFVLIKDAYVEDFEDAYDTNSGGWSHTTYLVHVHARYIRDDCLEIEDVPHRVVIRDSFFDGCFTAFAQRPSGGHSARNGDGRALLHRRVVPRARPSPQRLGPGYCRRRAGGAGALHADQGAGRVARGLRDLEVE